MLIIRAADCRKMPWKNGGGETTEIAVSPTAAGIEDFDWRLSMALVAAGGPFSTFAGVDRTLAVLDGDGLELTIEGMAPVTLTTASQPLAFPGDAPTSAALVGGEVTDLNIMTRRARVSHRMRRLAVSGNTELVAEAGELLIFCPAGTVRIDIDGEVAILSASDTLHLENAPAKLHIEAGTAATVFLIGLKHISE
ncbi:HutD family protein [Pseudaminobacter arsenicus]|uniref:HutD family protein n=1 Tax=Borborobacter arsenicus TaxID=1851146 RepID=A0A432V8N6_9HYPH|nr:HutD family protein [Pseudaminobacter arsenicus]RUM98506.1 HutD family protein [Pseudaminobacter arsenicus]